MEAHNRRLTTVSRLTISPTFITGGDFSFEGGSMRKLKRNVNMGFRVTEEEKQWILERMAQANISSLRVYLLKMAVNGWVVNLDLAEVSECSRLLRSISNNVNQIAKFVNTMGAVYVSDMEKIQSQLEAVWQQQDKILRSLSKILEAV